MPCSTSTAHPSVEIRSCRVVRSELSMGPMICRKSAEGALNDRRRSTTIVPGPASTPLPPAPPLLPRLRISGTMGNLIAVGVHCRRGDEIIVGSNSHMICYEATGASAFMGVSYSCVKNQGDGGISVEDIRAAVREDDPHYPRSVSEAGQSRCTPRGQGSKLITVSCHRYCTLDITRTPTFRTKHPQSGICWQVSDVVTSPRPG